MVKAFRVAKRACFKRDMVCRVDLKHEAPSSQLRCSIDYRTQRGNTQARGDDETGFDSGQVRGDPRTAPVSGAGHDASPYIQLVPLECYL